jgi:hypothetical protein
VWRQVIDEIAAGQGITFGQGARRVPASRGQGTAPSTLFRWARDGVLTPDGRRVRLEAARCGSRWLTTEAALRRFLEEQQPLPAQADAPEASQAEKAAPEKSAAAARRPSAAERAAEELARYGI